MRDFRAVRVIHAQLERGVRCVWRARLHFGFHGVMCGVWSREQRKWCARYVRVRGDIETDRVDQLRSCASCVCDMHGDSLKQLNTNTPHVQTVMPICRSLTGPYFGVLLFCGISRALIACRQYDRRYWESQQNPGS